MKITFLGGAKTVTGSSYLLEVGEEKILVDCGMFQGSKELEELNYRDWPFRPNEISYVVLTHAHIDHSGLLPRLRRDGFTGSIVCTKSTYELCSIMLPDSGHIQELEAEWKNKKRSRQRRRMVKPLYTQADALAVLPSFKVIPYHEKVELSPSIVIRLKDAGHILGSAIVELWAKEGERVTKWVFSGDIGSTGQAIVRDPELVEETDYLLVESTYGNRLHPTLSERTGQLLDVIRQAQRDNGLLIIPAFAVGRTQELLYQLHKLYKSGQIPEIPVYVDSPLAISATEIFQSNPDFYDEEAAALFQQGDNPLSFPNLRFVRSQEESQKLNFLKGTAILISASGMAEAGRILHHLKHHLWKPNNHVAFVGYQAEGSMGRRLLSGVKWVRIMGQTIRVGATIHDLSAFSAHADKEQLLAWLRGFKQAPRQVFVVHGEPESSEEFARTIEQHFGWKASVPSRGETVIVGESTVKIQETGLSGQVQLSDAELRAYLQALERNIEGLRLALGKYALSEEQSLQLTETLLKLNGQMEDLAEQV